MKIRSTNYVIIWVAVLFYTLMPCESIAAAVPKVGVSSIFNNSLNQTDILIAKIAFDDLVDTQINDPSTRSELTRLVLEASKLAGPRAGFREKMAAVRRVIYEPGPWNDGRAFQYDLVDPLGTKVENKLLATYLRSRRGNCVSMPVLFVIIAQRLGIDATLAVAPLHIFVKITDPSGREWNVETTDGANAMRVDWYRQKFAISDRAVESGIYLRKLSPRETTALLANLVVEKLAADGRYAEAVNAAREILAVSPRDVHALLHLGNAYGRMIETEFSSRYLTPAAIPPGLKPRWQMLIEANRKAFADAEALGWTPVP